MNNVIIIGCGFAGLEAAFMLRELGYKDGLAVVNRNEDMVFTPSLIWIPPRRRTLEELSIKLKPILSFKNINFICGEVASIDAKNSTVALVNGRSLDYDYLIVALGWQSKRSHIKGNEKILFPCDVPDVLKLTEAIGKMENGSITFAIEGERPGPGAEFLGWIDVYLREKGIRDRFMLNLVDEKHKLLVHLGRQACEILTANFKERRINLYLGKNLLAIRDGTAILDDGTAIPSDLICAVGKLEASIPLQKLDFSEADGFIPVNNDLTSKAYSNIYVAGDAASFGIKKVPKVAPLAIEQAQIAAINLVSSLGVGRKRFFDASSALANVKILSDFGGIAALAQGNKTLQCNTAIGMLKVLIERRYLSMHRAGRVARHAA